MHAIRDECTIILHLLVHYKYNYNFNVLYAYTIVVIKEIVNELSIDMYIPSPELTAGGSKEADIATPINEANNIQNV